MGTQVEVAERPVESPARAGLVAVIVISDLEYGGAQRQVVELANRLDEQGVTAFVCSLSDYVPLGSSLRRKDRLHIIRRRARYDFTVIFRLAMFVRRVHADVVHAFLFDAEIASRLAGCLVSRVAVICSERNTDYEMKASNLAALKATQRFQDLVIANSRAGADFNSALMKYDRDAYRVVRNGVDTERFRPRPADAVRQELGIPAAARVVGMFASFKPQKNHGLLLDAIPDVLARVDNVVFLFVGDALYKGMSDSDVYKPQLAKRVTEMDLEKRCVFAGNRLDVERLYPVCDLTVLPSLFEGTPNVVLESMACGVPVVATDVSDNRELVPEGEVGFIVPSGDAKRLAERMVTVLESPVLRANLSRAARTWAVEQLSTARLAERTADVYREAMSKKHS
jgi:glycosyltransferase involved in cell wall biosynthesis